MWNDLKALLFASWETRRADTHSEADVKLAAAALLVEIMGADFAADPVERAAIRALLIERFALPAPDADALLATAEEEVRRSVSLYPAVQLVNERMGREEKARLVGCLWDVAYADGRVDKYEDAAIRKIAELLYVDHGDFIRMKHRAAERRFGG